MGAENRAILASPSVARIPADVWGGLCNSVLVVAA
jgi:hypothetical protein